jgi:type I protein arginine methyltransferase
VSGYSVASYGEMIADRVRMNAYVRALRQAVTPGSVVIDIGTGTGIFAMLACQFGARRVYAVEPDDAIQVAREIAAANGVADRIEFLQDLSTRAVLPERADVIISDLRGVLPLYQRHISAVVDARERLLAPTGRLIPRRDVLWAAVTEAPELYRRVASPWGEDTHDVDMERARRIVTNTWTKRRIRPHQLLLPPQVWATLDYAAVTEADVHREIEWTAERSGTGDGVVVWFDADLAEGIGFSNSPGDPELIYGSAYFPLSQPVSLDKGDTMTVALHADLVRDDYVWRWDTRVLGKGRPEEVKANFRQSTLAGTPLSPQNLRRRADSHVAHLSEDGAIAQVILERMAGGMRNEEISREVALQFPHRFRTWQEALTNVGELATKYGA